ncbi:MAG: DNA-processing protein DprA [Clostridia bacterium]|nr:DNA-processing protein DprA [Clostridia bacterium]
MSEKLYFVWFSLSVHAYNKGARRLFEEIRNPEIIYNMQEADFEALGYLDNNTVSKLMNKNLDAAKRIIEGCDQKGYNIYTVNDVYYPAPLLNILYYPYVIYHRGLNFDYQNQLCISVVGTRNTTPYGVETAKILSRDLALNGALVISGMAAGIDTAAHKAAISVTKPTVAVLGTGVDLVTPVSNGDIYDYMVYNGAVISEFPPGTKGHPANFPQRNRIISGLCHGLLVVEAPQSSGALITANMALEQGKDIFAVPNSIDRINSYGTNRLIQKNCAKLIMDAMDILEEYPMFVTKQIAPAETKDKFKKEDFLASVKNLTPLEKVIAEAMGDEPMSIDYISDRTNVPANKILSALTMLEIKNVVKALPGRVFKLNIK